MTRSRDAAAMSLDGETGPQGCHRDLLPSPENAPSSILPRFAGEDATARFAAEIIP